MRLRLLLAALFALAFVQEARADIGEALAAYASGNYQEALDKARPLADQGNRDALRLMGDMHENGRGLPQNDALAWAHYYKAANGGDVESQFRLGQMYESGRGVPQSYAEASKWFQRAGLTGHTGAKAKLGKLTLAGRGTKVSFNKGLGLIEEAALSGEPEAESLLEDLERRGLASSARLSQDRQAPSDEESAGILLQTKQMVSALSAPFPLSPGLKLGGAPFIKRTAQGAWTVTLPKPAVAQSDGTVWQGASIRLAVTKADEDKLRVKVNLPPLWRYLTARGRENGRLEIGQQSVNGIWSVMLGQWIHTETALSGLTLSSPEGKGGIESLSVFANLTPGINGKGHDLVQTFNLKKASFADQSASGMSIQAIEANSRAESLELDTFRALSGQGKDADLNSLPSLAASFDNHLRLKGLKLTGPGGEEFLSVAGFEASMGALGMDQPASTLKAGIGATGIAATMRAGAAPSPFPLGAAPEKIALKLSWERLPLKDLTTQLAALWLSGAQSGLQASSQGVVLGDLLNDSLATALDSLIEAGSEIRIEDISAEAPAWGIVAKGAFTPERAKALPFSGKIVITARGLDHLIKSLDDGTNLAAAMLDGLRRTSPPKKDASGNDVFEVSFEASGAIDINGQRWSQPETPARQTKPTPLTKKRK